MPLENINEIFLRACELQDRGESVDAFKLFKTAAELGDGAAQNNLAVCFETGDGVDVDFDKAIYWYIQAINNGEHSAQSNIAGLYVKREDLDKAESWYLKAISNGDGDAAVDLAQMLLANKNRPKEEIILLLQTAISSESITPSTQNLAKSLLASILKT